MDRQCGDHEKDMFHLLPRDEPCLGQPMLRRLATGDERTIHDAVPPLSSTKALSGHSLGAASVHEAIYGLLMMRDGFMAASNHIEQLDERCEGFPILRETHDAKLDTVMSNSFGFGGTNATLVFGRV